MKKIKSLFIRTFEGHKITEVTRNVEEGCEWVLNGEGKATRKWDGTCTLIEDGKIFRRYDCKNGKTPPIGFIPAQEPDKITGHWPGWIEVDKNNKSGDNKFFIEAYINTFGNLETVPLNGTYELCGPKIGGNPEKLDKHIFIKHGEEVVFVERNYDSIKNFLENNYIEGIVFHRENGDMCKIKRVDFGFEWNGKNTKR